MLRDLKRKIGLISELDKKLYKTIITSYFSKIISVVTSLLVVPLVLNYLGQEKFGFLITLVTLLGWLYLFDLGIGSSVKNLVSEAFAKNNTKLLNKIFLNSVLLLGLVFIIISILSILIIPHLNWYLIFKVKSLSNSEISLIIISAIIFYVLNMLLSIGLNFLYGIQKGYISNYFNAIGNILSLIGIYIIIKLKLPTIFIVNTYSAGFLIGNLLSVSYLLFIKKAIVYTNDFYDKSVINSIFKLGSKFLFLGIISMIIYTADNILITQGLGPTKIAEYNPIMRLYQFIIQANGLFTLSLWPAYANAIAGNDFVWVKKKFLFSLKVTSIVFLPFVFVLMVFGPSIISLWLHNAVVPSQMLCILIGFWTIIYLYNQLFASLLNGAGIMGKQIKFGLFSVLIFIISGYFLIKTYGLIGLSIAGILSSIIGIIVNPYIIIKFFKSKFVL